MSEQKKRKGKIIDRRGHPLPEGHPFKGAQVYFGNPFGTPKRSGKDRQISVDKASREKIDG